jgi:hypothetical protein
MAGQLGLQGGLDHAARELRQQPARPDDLLRAQAREDLVKDVGRQQLLKALNDPRRRLGQLALARALAHALIFERGTCTDGHGCPSRPQTAESVTRTTHTSSDRTPARARRRHFNLLDQTRALENQVVWVSSNQVGRFGRLRFAGQSKVVDPRGRVLARTGARAGAAVARVDAPGLVAAARERLSYLDDRRPQAYGDERLSA